MAFTDLEARMRRRHPAPQRRRNPVDLVVSLLVGIACVIYAIKLFAELPDRGSLWSGLYPYFIVMAAMVGGAVFGLRRLREQPMPGLPDPDAIEVPRAGVRRR